MLEKQMTCDYHRLNRFASLNHHATAVKSTTQLFHCVKRALTSKAEETCLLEAQERCEEKPLRFIKTIRLSVESASVLLDSYPCAKLIYMIRDPRGSYHSKTKMFASHGQNVTWDAERFCTKLGKDVDSVIELKKKYPDRVHVTRFETIATHPIVSTKNIYDFIGLEFTRSIAMFVYKKTHSKTAGMGYSTDRANAIDACYKWRRTIPFEHASAFDNFCSEPFFKLGYLPANSLKDLRNTNKTLLFNRELLS
ncbi:carbohydrate sulfotransferase 1 [Elysia marginata]|uniref:Carbohydrate sulfotransferase 1 n=1 Tax=Elysia marginata TaxID=1093978 RepID=A0AAV4IQD8_9GAST|nr:carbohydrate sulfotransferase 1 [Elysia marginata]